MNIKIVECMDMAQTFPDSGIINWGEVPFEAMASFATQENMNDYDVESVQQVMVEQWKLHNTTNNGGSE